MLVIVGIWNYLRPAYDLEQVALSVLVFLLCLVFSFEKRFKPIPMAHFLLSLEIKNPRLSRSAFEFDSGSGDSEAEAESEWQHALARESKTTLNVEVKRNIRLLSTLVLPLLALALIFVDTSASISATFSSLRTAVSSLGQGVTLTILQGPAKEITVNTIPLSDSKPPKIELISQNMVEVRFIKSGTYAALPSVELRKKKLDEKGQVSQSFQMSRLNETGDTTANSEPFQVTFSVSDDVDLYIPSLSAKPYAEILVRQLPIPKVELTLESPSPQDPWPDDQALPLRIQVKADNPLRLVRVLITSGKRTSQELVNNILSEDLFLLDTNYNLLLEPYVESDLADVEIVAEAVDRSLPSPLTGRSEPLRIRTASAYGRYRQVLDTLRDLKVTVDQTQEGGDKKLPKDASKLINTAVQQSDNSPFFDGLDRIDLVNFENLVTQSTEVADPVNLLDLSDRLNKFLFEHEVLDDRERDRDFFVAVRGLSRVLEQERRTRQVTVAVVNERIINFLNSRHERWKKRVARLTDAHQPKSWPKIAERPFHKAMENVQTLDAKNSQEGDAQALIQLSKTTAEYRSWIEELEAKEDEVRAEMEKKRQEGLASAQNELRELQRRQGQISQELDRAELQTGDQLSDKWPSMRMEQNTNLQATKKVEGQLRSLSNQASQRIKAAAESMKQTLESGNGKAFVEAESSSDMAGRLLRQAENAARKEQNQQNGRGRRRRVSGDRYYGQPVAVGDVEIQREYQVDKRYREDILDEVRQTLSNSEEEDNKENRRVLENYLRQVIR